MITLNHVVRKNENVSSEAFREYWLGEHAEKVMALSSKLGIKKYTKCEALIDDDVTGLLSNLYRTDDDCFDFVDQMLINDLADFKKGMADPEVAEAFKALFQESLAYINPLRSNFWFTVAVPQLLSRESMVATFENTYLKGIYIAKHRDEITLTAAQLHWNACHGGMASQYSEMLPYERYIQQHQMPSKVVNDLKSYLGVDFPNSDAFIGQAEVWLDRKVIPTLQGPETEKMLRLLADDIDLFVKPEERSIFATKEHILFSNSLINEVLPTLFNVD